MEAFFGNSIVFLFFLAALAIFNYTDMRLEQRISIIYISVYAMTIIGNIGTKTAWLFLLLTMFCYLEIFTDDKKKVQLLVNPLYKLVDCLYLSVMQYGLLPVLVAVSCHSYLLETCLGKYVVVIKGVSIIILIHAITTVLRQKFAINSFQKMYWIFDQYPIYQVRFDEKFEQVSQILVAIEDRRYFERQGYSILDFSHIFRAVRKKIRNKSFCEKWMSAKNFVGEIAAFERGYSTIPMQIIRSIGIAEGYDCKIRRKIYELLYPRMFFDGMKQMMKDTRTQQRDRFPQYLLYIYFHVTKTDLGDGYKNYLSVFEINKADATSKDIYSCSNEGIFIACMGLSKRARKIRAGNIDYYLTQIPVDLDRQAILNMKENMLKRPYGGKYLR